MIKTESLTVNGMEYIRTYSDQGFLVEHDGAFYEEAVDPADSGRTYTETDISPEADEGDYLVALERFGVK